MSATGWRLALTAQGGLAVGDRLRSRSRATGGTTSFGKRCAASLVLLASLSLASPIASAATRATQANDIDPDPFTFAPVTGASPGLAHVSAPVTIRGFDTPSPISIKDGQYRINSQPYTAEPGLVYPNDRVTVGTKASRQKNTAMVTTLTIGGVAGTFTVTTAATIDTSPDTFSFEPVDGAAVSSTQASTAVTITGISGPSPISVSGGRYRINAGEFTNLASTVNAGDKVYAEVLASAQPDTTSAATIDIGGVNDAFVVTTETGIDTVPDSFSFPPVDNATPGATYTSAPATITGIDGPAPIGVTGGRYAINGGPPTDLPGTVELYDQVSAELVASDQNSASSSASVTIGGVPGTFVVTTNAARTAQYPADVLNLKPWKLTLPVNSKGGKTGTAAEIQPKVLVGPPPYSSPYFYTDANGAVVFYAPTNGASTSPGSGSDSTRTELRELYKPSGATDWTNAVGGTLTASCRIDKVPAVKRSVIIGQIHGTPSIMMLLMYNEAKRVIEAKFYNSPSSNSSITTVQMASNVRLGDRIDYRIQWIGSSLSVSVNGKTVTRQTASSWNGVKVYFKAGIYSGTANQGNSSSDASQASYYSLDVRH